MILVGYLIFATVYAVLSLLAVATVAFLYGGAWVVLILVTVAARLIGCAWRPSRRPPSRIRPRRPQAAWSDRR